MRPEWPSPCCAASSRTPHCVRHELARACHPCHIDDEVFSWEVVACKHQTLMQRPDHEECAGRKSKKDKRDKKKHDDKKHRRS